jgi:hypothetical protein
MVNSRPTLNLSPLDCAFVSIFLSASVIAFSLPRALPLHFRSHFYASRIRVPERFDFLIPHTHSILNLPHKHTVYDYLDALFWGRWTIKGSCFKNRADLYCLLCITNTRLRTIQISDLFCTHTLNILDYNPHVDLPLPCRHFRS